MKYFLLGTTVISLTGIGGYITGILTEKQNCEFDFSNFKNKVFFENLPALPLYGTVSAAVPVPAEDDVHNHKTSAFGDAAIRTSQIMKYGFPSLENVRSYSNYVLSYDQRNRVAHWVFEHLTSETLRKNKGINRSKCDFKEDASIHPFFRSLNSDYKYSGFDRGHLAAAGNHRICQEHVNETFYLSNIAPQVGSGFNRDIWNSLEQYVRKLARIHKNVYVCTGPLYLPKKEADGKTYIKYQVIGENHVAVPTHFFKIIVMENDDNDLEMESYVMPNQIIENGTPLHLYQVPPETVERASGLLFFNRLSRNKLKRINNKKL